MSNFQSIAIGPAIAGLIVPDKAGVKFRAASSAYHLLNGQRFVSLAQAQRMLAFVGPATSGAKPSAPVYRITGDQS